MARSEPTRPPGARPSPALITTGLLALVAVVVGPMSSPGQVMPPGHPGGGGSFPFPPGMWEIDLRNQSDQDIARKNGTCVQCHQGVGDPHMENTARLGCVDCHGGNPTAPDKHHAHVQPRFPGVWRTSGNPVRSYTVLNHESPEFIRFVNPGDLRINHLSCGTTGCHGEIVGKVRKHIMAHGAMLWEAALYNNGSYPKKHPRFGESYSMIGTPQRLQTVPPPTEYEMKVRGVLPYLDPLPKFEI